MATQPTGMTIEQRRAILQKEINGYVKNGWQVVSQTDTTAQLKREKVFSCLWAVLWTLALGIGLIFYLIWYWGKRDQTVYLEVDERGKLKRR